MSQNCSINCCGPTLDGKPDSIFISHSCAVKEYIELRFVNYFPFSGKRPTTISSRHNKTCFTMLWYKYDFVYAKNISQNLAGLTSLLSMNIFSVIFSMVEIWVSTDQRWYWTTLIHGLAIVWAECWHLYFTTTLNSADGGLSPFTIREILSSSDITGICAWYCVVTVFNRRKMDKWVIELTDCKINLADIHVFVVSVHLRVSQHLHYYS